MHVTDEADSAGAGTLMLHLTGRCNLRCRHCYMEGGPDRDEQLALGPLLAAVEAAPALGFGSLYVTGGEPLLYPHIDAVIEAAASLPPPVQRTLCSNGTRLTADRARSLARAGFTLSISLDGDAPFHDRFRRLKGAHAAALAGIRIAVGAGCPVTIISTISRPNLAMATPLAETAMALGARTFRVQPLLDLGRGHALAPDRLDADELNGLLLALTDLANRMRPRLGISIIGKSLRYLRAHPCAAYVCNGGGCHRRVARELKKLVVREDGTILPEATNLHPRWALGRLGDAPLDKLITRYLDTDYDRFDQLCRTTYRDTIPDWTLPIVPWDQLLAEASHRAVPAPDPGQETEAGQPILQPA